MYKMEPGEKIISITSANDEGLVIHGISNFGRLFVLDTRTLILEWSYLSVMNYQSGGAVERMWGAKNDGF